MAEVEEIKERLIELTGTERTELRAALGQEWLSPRVRERLEMVKAADLGHDLETIAAWSRRTPRTVRRWLAAFAAGGVADVSDAPRSGRPPRADESYLRALEDALESRPRDLGLGFDVWTSGRLCAHLEERVGVRIAPGWLRALLARRRFACGRPKHTLSHLRDPEEVAACEAELAEVEKKVAEEPERYEMHYQDETHLETNPYLCKVWHRVGEQPTLPAVGTNRRVTVFGSVEAFGRGRVDVACAGQDSACFLLYLRALDARHEATGREVFLVLDNGSCHTSGASRAALAGRGRWLHPIWLARYSPHLNPKEREWRTLKRDARSHLARTLREFVDGILEGLGNLGGMRLDIVDKVPEWFIAGHRKAPTGRPPGRPKGAKDSRPRKPYERKNLPAVT